MKFKIFRKILMFTFVIFFMTSCATFSKIEPVVHLPKSKTPDNQKLVIFIDGTENDEKDITNVFKLKNLVTLQKRNDIKTIYIEGVGTNKKFLGATLGTGFGLDIRQAYEFLTIHYKGSNNKIHLFGFSRGAYAVRILSGLIQVAGIPDLSNETPKKREKIIKKIYEAYKSTKEKNYEHIDKVLKKQKEKISKLLKPYDLKKNIKIESVGIWDSVEALATPDYVESVVLNVRPQIDQLCNVRHIIHALSLDDDRARIFTPIFITNKASVEQCGKEIINSRKINQVFFSGAHSDVGGGYSDTEIDGVSLNWMIGELNGYNLLPKNSGVYSDAYGKTHDPETGFFKLAYRFQHRDLSKYVAILDDKLKVHSSVIDRLECIPRKCHEIQWVHNENIFRHCFKEQKDGTLKYDKSDSKCLMKVVEDKDYKSGPCIDISKDIPLCNDNNRFPCKLLINANSRNNMSVKLEEGSKYEFSIKIIEKWSDAGICATPEDGRTISRQDISKLDKGILYVGKVFSYLPNAGFMELLGKMDNYIFSIGKLVKNNKIYIPKKSSKLEVFVNEPVGSADYYNNNQGKLYLMINKK